MSFDAGKVQRTLQQSFFQPIQSFKEEPKKDHVSISDRKELPSFPAGLAQAYAGVKTAQPPSLTEDERYFLGQAVNSAQRGISYVDGTGNQNGVLDAGDGSSGDYLVQKIGPLSGDPQTVELEDLVTYHYYTSTNLGSRSELDEMPDDQFKQLMQQTRQTLDTSLQNEGGLSGFIQNYQGDTNYRPH